MKSNPNTKDKTKIYTKREQDWRNGAIVYQVLVDRFAPATDLDGKRHLYQAPKSLKTWDELPKPGPFLEEVKYTAHELEYWGGDLASLTEKLGYIVDLNVDVLYLNPIHFSLSNHKYDATDYKQISPEFGTFDDLTNLANNVHNNGMKLMLDGVFNHVGVANHLFQEAQDPNSERRDWFDFNDKYEDGVRLWADVKSLPELNLEHQAVKDYIYNDEDSVIRRYLKLGIDGWRLDVAFDLGYQVLSELTNAAHEEKTGSMVVGEIWNYPKDWLNTIDGVMNFTFRELILRTITGTLSPAMFNTMIQKVIEDTGIEGILKSWTLLDNHDVPRLRHLLPQDIDQRLAQVLQFTLPGSPNLYYGTELGMTGGVDPMNRAPMKWDWVTTTNPYLLWTKSLIALRKQERALRVGDYLPLITTQLIGFERYTDQIKDSIVTIVNPTNKEVHDHILLPDSKWMNFTGFDILLGEASNLGLVAGLLTITLPAKSYVIFKPSVEPKRSYTPYKRV